jgi:hypothetical protein
MLFFCVCLRDQRDKREHKIPIITTLGLTVFRKKRSLLSQAPPNPKESNYEKSFNDKLHRRVNGMPAYKSHNIYTPVERLQIDLLPGAVKIIFKYTLPIHGVNM